MKKALLVAPTWMELYIDIIRGLEIKGYEVNLLSDKLYRFDPDNVRADYKLPKFAFAKFKTNYWKKKLNSNKYREKYDLLFVVNGTSLCPYFFETLKKRNPNIRMVNYLYDTIRGVYRFDGNFEYYDKIVTFDVDEAKLYKTCFLPIYWCPIENKTDVDYSVFGFGAFSPFRFSIFKKVAKILDNHQVKSKINVYFAEMSNEYYFGFKIWLRKLLGKPSQITLDEYNDKIIEHKTIPSDEFKKIVNSVDTVLDTSPLHQDGLTARFMWAIGAGKKIITTNDSVSNYDFYTRDQILIISKNPEEISPSDVVNFVHNEFRMSDDIRKIVNKYRIDNWLDFLLN